MKFADTSWWAAWALPGDRNHDRAVDMLALVGKTEKVLTTNLIVGECWTFLRRKDSHRSAVAFVDRAELLAERGKLVIHHVEPEQETAAWEWLRRHDEREYSFVDATSFRVMADRRLGETLAFDGDFSAAGFIELRP